MLKRTGLCVLVAIAAAACGSASSNDFSGPTGQSGHAAGGGAGVEATGGSPGAGGSSQGGGGGSIGGSAQGGSNTGGTSGGSQGLGGIAGDLIAGTGGDGTGGTGMDTGGTGPSTGGTGMDTGGTGMDTGGTGGTGMSTGGGAGMPAMGGAGGTGPSCDELATQYDAALQAAQVCNPNSGKDQCSGSEYSQLVCGCPVAVNPENQEAVAELEQLRKTAATSCHMNCPKIACVLPQSVSCIRDPAAGRDVGRCAATPGLPTQ